MKFNDEELSRIMSAHANGELRRKGYEVGNCETKCCVLQAAYWAGDDRLVAPMSMNQYLETADWFDTNYNPGWPLGKFLRELEKRGLA